MPDMGIGIILLCFMVYGYIAIIAAKPDFSLKEWLKRFTAESWAQRAIQKAEKKRLKSQQRRRIPMPFWP